MRDFSQEWAGKHNQPHHRYRPISRIEAAKHNFVPSPGFTVEPSFVDLSTQKAHTAAMQIPTKLVLALTAASFATPIAAAQITVTLEPSQDNTLYESATGSNSNGAGSAGFAGSNSNGSIRRFLLQFDIAGAIPPGSTISSASLDLLCTQVPSGSVSDNYGAHRTLSPWGEGTSNGSGNGAPATTGDATWLHTFFSGTFWATPGGDFAPLSSADAAMNSVGTHNWASPLMITDAQFFLDNPTSNFGWLIKSATEVTKTARRIGTRESSSDPILTLTYTPPSFTITPYCDPASNNSTGAPAVLTGVFTGAGFETGLHLDVAGGPLPLGGSSPMLGYFLVGNTSSDPGLAIGDGFLCIGQPGAGIGRYNAVGTARNSIGIFDASGNLQNLAGTGGPSGMGFDVPFAIEISGAPATTIMGGDTYYFQCWHRDTLAGLGHSNLSNALAVTF
ncbi:MAG: hypothetical protein ACI9X4_000796 [Glaciecola sp.]